MRNIDKGFIVAGRHGISFSRSDLLLLKTDSLGNQQWVKFIALGPWEHEGHNIKQTADSGFIITGMRTGTGLGSDVFLVKTDMNGDTLWTRTFSTTGYDLGCEVQPTFDGGYAIACVSKDSIGWLIRTDGNGDTLWTKSFYFPGYIGCELRGLVQTPDSGFACAGLVAKIGFKTRALLIRTNKNGDTLWTKNYFKPGIEKERSYSIYASNDGGFIMSGLTPDPVPPNWNFYVVKVDINGDTIWAKSIGALGDDGGGNIIQNNNGDYFLSGFTYSYGAGNGDLFVVKLESSGNIKWQKTFGGANIDVGYFVNKTYDDGFIATGVTTSFISLAEVYLVRGDTAGNIVSIKEPKQNSVFTAVYPNPAGDEITILYNFPNEIRTASIEIYDQIGNLCYMQTLDVNASAFKTSGLNLLSGIYYYRIIGNSVVMKAEKLVIIR